MNREMRRISEKEGRRLQKLPWNSFRNVTREAHEKHRLLNGNSNFRPNTVWQNNKYIVQVFNGQLKNDKLFTKVMVRRSDSQAIYSWQDLYRIKNEIFGDEIEAIQFMPKKSELVDDANLYWFWIEE